jgi:cell division protein ZapA (FtsZ GTPase activity inhibitor)
MPGELQRPPTRSELNRELMVRAATSWDGLVALAVVAGAGVVLGLPVLILVAVVLWLAASVWHYFDGSEADKLAAERAAKRQRIDEAARLNPAALCEPVSRELRRARAQEASIRQTIMESELPSELTGDIDALVQAFEATARRADIMYRTLERQQENGQGAADLDGRIAQLRASGRALSEDEKALVTALNAQLSAARRAEELRDRFFTTMERMVAELGTIDSEILGMSASEAATAQQQVAGQLSDLRELVSGLAGDMQQSQKAAADLPAV